MVETTANHFFDPAQRRSRVHQGPRFVALVNGTGLEIRAGGPAPRLSVCSSERNVVPQHRIRRFLGSQPGESSR